MRFLPLLLLAIPLALFGHRSARQVEHVGGTTDLRLSAISSELARRPVQIRCEGARTELMNPSGESGHVEFLDGKAGDKAVLERGVCAALHVYSQSTKRGQSCLLPCDGSAAVVVWSLNTLAHESYHLGGVRNEAATQCYALQTIGFVARRLGASSVQADALAHWAKANLPQRMPREYWSPECRRGGQLDLRRLSAASPSG